MPAVTALATTEANVVEVFDGDSVMLLVAGELRRFEVLGADTPEWRAKDPEPSAGGVIARMYLTRLLLHERVRVFEPEPGAVDQVGRRRGYLFRMPDGLSVDLEIVRQGYGKVSTRAEEPFEAALRWYEVRAKELGRGVWGEPDGDLLPELFETDTPTEGLPDSEPEPAEVVDAPVPDEPEPEPGGDRWVWITRSGSKYHRDGCRHLKDSRSRVERDGLDPSLSPCQTCRPDG